jgi:hypothetical protein
MASETAVRIDASCEPAEAASSAPHAPRTLEECDVDVPMLVALCARVLLQRGRQKLAQLSDCIKLPPSVVAQLLALMRAERLVEIAGHTGVESEAAYQLSESGRQFAREAMQRCHYVGPAPVSLMAYSERISAFPTRRYGLDARRVRNSLSHLVLDPNVVDQMGAAMNSGRAILLFGPAGSGKTFLAEHLGRLLPGHVLVPHAITVGGEIIQVFDPLMHVPVPVLRAEGLMRSDRDARWLACHRPTVLAGGELTLQMLDLQFDPVTRYYQAPPQVKATGGMFVVDDLGRQMVAPRDLMNRWIVPLDRKLDFLTLHTGFRFALPFDMTMIFSTNLTPDALADEAFLRRFGYKVHLGPVDPVSYRLIFEDACEAAGVRFDLDAFEWLVDARHIALGRSLLACYPRDLVGRVHDFARYEGCEPELTRESLGRAWNTYFHTVGAFDRGA